MQTVNRLQTLRKSVDALRHASGGAGPVALVPTMGALHDGHLTLVREARSRAASVVVSIFVNPAQFGPNEDFDAYPRQLDADQDLLAAEGVDLLWAPTPEIVYPPGFATNIAVRGVSEGLCGAARPGHFDGVATVVCKLFNQVLPDMAFFGEKDWQQLAVIRRMARDLDLVRPGAEAIFGVPIVREADGLAMSSRNRYLSQAERASAAALPAALREGVAQLESGAPFAQVRRTIRDALAEAGFVTDYVELADARDLTPLPRAGDRPARLLAAARIGTTRLIDNFAVAPRSG